MLKNNEKKGQFWTKFFHVVHHIVTILMALVYGTMLWQLIAGLPAH